MGGTSNSTPGSPGPKVKNTGQLSPRTRQTFWARANVPDGCWIWTGSRDAFGYGVVIVEVDGKKKPMKAHRAAWQLAYGPIPPQVFVLHRCDNKPCVNPLHLFLGSIADNNRDRAAKGRSFRLKDGEAHPAARLTVNDVRTIRARFAAGELQRDIAADYQLSQATVSRITLRSGRTGWTHIPFDKGYEDQVKRRKPVIVRGRGRYRRADSLVPVREVKKASVKKKATGGRKKMAGT